MQNDSERGIVFRFRRPGGSMNQKPSTALVQALRHLSRAQEMKPLLMTAQATGREVVIEVFHSKSGQPLLIHTALLPEKTA